MRVRTFGAFLLILAFTIAGVWGAIAQPHRPRPHNVTQSDGFEPISADRRPSTPGSASIEINGDFRFIVSNGIPEHGTGAFPNRGNPNRIESQRYRFHVPVRPGTQGEITPLRRQLFGVAVNGVPFDPGAAEWYLGDRRSSWQYEALSGAVPLGIDANNAHVQPTGAYHYHGLPVGLLQNLGWREGKHSPIVGWAADGFPIYALYGFAVVDDPGSGVREIRSSHPLRSGKRPNGSGDPGGVYDGTFTADYEYQPGSGDLDICNGRVAVTPEFPSGTYVYFLTRDWPVIPRCFWGEPDPSFVHRRPQGGPPGGRHRGPPGLHGRGHP